MTETETVQDTEGERSQVTRIEFARARGNGEADWRSSLVSCVLNFFRMRVGVWEEADDDGGFWTAQALRRKVRINWAAVRLLGTLYPTAGETVKGTGGDSTRQLLRLAALLEAVEAVCIRCSTSCPAELFNTTTAKVPGCWLPTLPGMGNCERHVPPCLLIISGVPRPSGLPRH